MSVVSPIFIDLATRASLVEMMGEPTFDIFVTRMESEIQEFLRDAQGLIDAQRFEEAALAAHKVAGSAAVLGAEGLRQLIIRFETTARGGHTEGCQTLLSEIADNSPNALAALRNGR